MSTKNFFTTFFDSLSDLETRFDFDREIKSKLIENRFYNSFKGKKEFHAIVLEVDQTTSTAAETNSNGAHVFCKVRPLDIHNFIIPEPCEPINGKPPSAKQVQERIDLHPRAISDFIGNGYRLAAGDVVRCYYKEQGPQFEGKMRSLRFKTDVVTHAVGKYSYKCLDKKSSFFSSPTAYAAFRNQLISQQDTPKTIGSTYSEPEYVAPTNIQKSEGDLLSTNSNYQLKATIKGIIKLQLSRQQVAQDNGNVLIIGDSNMTPTGYGDFLEKQFQPIVKKKGFNGKGPSFWTNHSYLDNYISSGKSTGLIIIGLGGNNIKGTKELAKKITSAFPATNIIWIGPPPMSVNGHKYKYDQMNPSRKKRAYKLGEILANYSGITYINPYEVIGDSYTCTQRGADYKKYCDGVHMKGPNAKEFLEKAGLLVEEGYVGG